MGSKSILVKSIWFQKPLGVLGLGVNFELWVLGFKSLPPLSRIYIRTVTTLLPVGCRVWGLGFRVKGLGLRV
jgi:hypothetical protein